MGTDWSPKVSRKCFWDGYWHRRWSRRRSGGDRVSPRFGAEKTLLTMYDIFDNTCDISDFRAHIFCPQTTQELPKKHKEVGPPEQLPTDALSQIDYGYTRHCEDCFCQRTTQRAFLENLSKGMRWLSGRWAPPRVKTLRRLWLVDCSAGVFWAGESCLFMFVLL